MNEFKPALKFLFVFLGLYLGGNILYGVFIEIYNPSPDPVTETVAVQTAWVLRLLGHPVFAIANPQDPTIFLREGMNTVLNIYEGCNGINVAIVLIAFLAAFGGNTKKLRWFLPMGIAIVHLANITRIVLLYFVAVKYSRYFYYVHKYVFTAAIYLIVVLLWIIWVTKVNERPKRTAAV